MVSDFTETHQELSIVSHFAMTSLVSGQLCEINNSIKFDLHVPVGDIISLTYVQASRLLFFRSQEKFKDLFSLALALGPLVLCNILLTQRLTSWIRVRGS
jgi:hypothetical protein